MQGFAAVLPSALGSIYAANEGPCHGAKFTVWVQLRVPFWKQAVVPGIQLDDMIRQNAQAETISCQPKSSSQSQGDEMRSVCRKGCSRAGGTMTEVAPHIRVVAAIIEQRGRYLITQRRSMDVLAGLWEFPSGKVEAGETDEAALRRELRERAGATADVGGVIAQRTHRSGSHVVDLVLYRATIASTKEPRALRVAELRWVAPQELGNYAFPLADQATTDLLLGTAQLDN